MWSKSLPPTFHWPELNEMAPPNCNPAVCPGGGLVPRAPQTPDPSGPQAKGQPTVSEVPARGYVEPRELCNEEQREIGPGCACPRERQTPALDPPQRSVVRRELGSGSSGRACFREGAGTDTRASAQGGQWAVRVRGWAWGWRPPHCPLGKGRQADGLYSDA